jgi:hypothetical protein
MTIMADASPEELEATFRSLPRAVKYGDLETLDDRIAALERAIKSLRCELDEVEFALIGVITAFEDLVKIK